MHVRANSLKLFLHIKNSAQAQNIILMLTKAHYIIQAISSLIQKKSRKKKSRKKKSRKKKSRKKKKLICIFFVFKRDEEKKSSNNS
jgi:hypothetical protein